MNFFSYTSSRESLELKTKGLDASADAGVASAAWFSEDIVFITCPCDMLIFSALFTGGLARWTQEHNHKDNDIWDWTVYSTVVSLKPRGFLTHNWTMTFWKGHKVQNFSLENSRSSAALPRNSTVLYRILFEDDNTQLLGSRTSSWPAEHSFQPLKVCSSSNGYKTILYYCYFDFFYL